MAQGVAWTERTLRQLGHNAVNATISERHRDRRRHVGNFPFTDEHIACTLRRLGTPVGQRAAGAIRRLLIEAGVIEHHGWYEKADGHGNLTGVKVRLYRIVTRAMRRAASCLQSSVGKVRSNSPRSGFAHPLFGDPEHAKLLRDRLKKWSEPPDWMRARDEKAMDQAAEAGACALDVEFAAVLDLDG